VVADETQQDGRSGVWGGSRFDMISHAELRGPKQVRHEKSWQLRPVYPQFIAKANPTPASKLAVEKNGKSRKMEKSCLAKDTY
jgi:hypothetical protein